MLGDAADLAPVFVAKVRTALQDDEAPRGIVRRGTSVLVAPDGELVESLTAEGARRPSAPGDGRPQRAARRGARGLGRDGEVARRPHPRQARGHEPHWGRRARPGARAGLSGVAWRRAGPSAGGADVRRPLPFGRRSRRPAPRPWPHGPLRDHPRRRDRRAPEPRPRLRAPRADGARHVPARSRPPLDQAGLHGLLRRVRDAGLGLVAVSRIPHHPHGGSR